MGHWRTQLLDLFVPGAWAVGGAVTVGIVFAPRSEAVMIPVALATGFVVAVALAWGVMRQRHGRADQTKRVRLDTKLAELESTLAELPGAVWWANATGDRGRITEGWRTLTGQDPDAALGQGWIDRVHADDVEACRSTILLAASNREEYRIEYRIRNVDGSIGWLADAATPRFDGESGDLTGFIGQTTDVTRLKQSGDASIDTPNTALHLNETINSKTVALVDRFEILERAKQRAEYAERLKCEFLAALSDELAAPAGEVRHVAELMGRGDLTPDQEDLVVRAREASRRLQTLVDRARELRVLDEEESPLAEDALNLRRLVEQVVDRTSKTFGDQETIIASTIGDLVPVMVRTDEARLRRVLLDVVAAAARLAAGGRVTLRVSREHNDKDRSTLHFSATILGDGVDDTMLSRAYFPADSIGGAAPGLGLGACKRVVEHLNGKLGVQRDERDRVSVWTTLTVVELNPNNDGRREHGRLSQEAVTSSVGTVLDLSMGGMRVRCTRPPVGEVEFELRDDEEAIDLVAEVAWTKRLGFGKHEVGLRFLDPDRDATEKLGRLAARNRLRRVMDVA